MRDSAEGPTQQSQNAPQKRALILYVYISAPQKEQSLSTKQATYQVGPS